MKLLDKIKLWFSGVSKIVYFLMNSYTELKDVIVKKEGFKSWVDFINAFIADALQYALELEKIAKEASKDKQQGSTKTPTIVTASVEANTVESNISMEITDDVVTKPVFKGSYQTSYFKDRVKNFEL